MEICCKLLWYALSKGMVRPGCDRVDTNGGMCDIIDARLTILNEKEWMQICNCPFCGKDLDIVFDGDEEKEVGE